jgi:AcrR family transcriptional regulator
MQNLIGNIHIRVPEHIYLKDPETSELGKKILTGGLSLLHEKGFEDFTFKKLGALIGTTEASIYRYFESKHKLLLYYTAWYWGLMNYKLSIVTANIKDPLVRLEKAIQLVTEDVKEVEDSSFIDENKLFSIMISESSKSYLIKEVDIENKQGVYMGYKQLVARISEIILEINPSFKYARMLVTTCIEGAHFQRYFAEHLPRLTDTNTDINDDSVSRFYQILVNKSIFASNDL